MSSWKRDLSRYIFYGDLCHCTFLSCLYSILLRRDIHCFSRRRSLEECVYGLSVMIKTLFSTSQPENLITSFEAESALSTGIVTETGTMDGAGPVLGAYHQTNTWAKPNEGWNLAKVLSVMGAESDSLWVYFFPLLTPSLLSISRTPWTWMIPKGARVRASMVLPQGGIHSRRNRSTHVCESTDSNERRRKV